MFDITKSVISGKSDNKPYQVHIVEGGNLADLILRNGAGDDKALYAQMGSPETLTQAFPYKGTGNSDYTGYIVTTKPEKQDVSSPYTFAHIPHALPDLEKSEFVIGQRPDGFKYDDFVLGWMIGQYNYSLSQKVGQAPRILNACANDNVEALQHEALAVQFTRNLVNMPADILDPKALAHQGHELAERYKKDYIVTQETTLAEGKFPLIYQVGKAATEEGRLFDATFVNQSFNETKANILIVGKGITYDSGGLALKDHHGMSIMHKDMGGAAHALGLARILLEKKLPINIRLILPIADNETNEKSLKNGAVIPSLNGEWIDVVNTDAEGRLVLADAFSHAIATDAGFKPDLMVDFATLTGAARIASYPHHPAVFTTDPETGFALRQKGREIGDYINQQDIIPEELPNVRNAKGYLLNSLGDACAQHVGATSFLYEFTKHAQDKNGEMPEWIHVDTSAWQYTKDSGRPVGGSDRGLRTVAHHIIQKYG